MSLLADLREQISQQGKYIFESGLTSKYSGNISVRDRENGLIAIKPSGVPWMDITPNDIVVIDESGNVVEGKRKPSIETPMHTAVYRNYPETMAVVHTHSRYATGFAVARIPIPAICVNSVELGGEIPVLPYSPPGSQENAEMIAAGLRDRKAILLAAHGVLCHAEDLEKGIYYNETLEEVALLAIIKKVLGSNAKLSPEEVAIISAL
jgi:ribulose-5-phosphate 4-epimerase/fuculose-1-phosphate aldolase